jgi:hypothetical protein
MKVRLATDRVPEQASLESVLPGVNERLGGVESRMGRLEGGVRTYVGQVQEEGEKTRTAVKHALQAAADSFAEKVRISRPEMMADSTDNNSTMAVEHRMEGVVKSVQCLYDEWHGLGRFKGVPVDGGVSELERRFKAKWRPESTWRGASKYVSRVKMIMQAIDLLRNDEEDDNGNESAIDQMEIWFLDKAIGKKTISGLASAVQAKGIVAKGKRRGRGA